MNVWIISIMLLCVSLMITACGGGKDKINTLGETSSSVFTLSGIVQKGPAQPNAMIILYEVDHHAKRTGRQLITNTIGKQGAFTFQMPTLWQSKGNQLLVEVVFSGHFFDESTGTTSVSPVQLSAFISPAQNQSISVNILTTLMTYRIRNLMSQGVLFSKAHLSAATSLHDIMGVSGDIALTADMTQLSHPKENAILLFLSGSIAELSQYYNESAQRIIDQIATNFAIDGQLSGLGEQWEQRLKRMSLNQEASKMETYSAHLQRYLGEVNLPNASHLPDKMRVTTRPVADAGEDQIVPPGVTVRLNGLNSHDVQGGEVKHIWFQTDQGNNPVTLSDRFIASPQFIAPENLNQTLWFALIVTDNNKITDTDTVKISIAEVLPSIDDLPEITDEQQTLLKNTIQVVEGGRIEFPLLINDPLEKGVEYLIRSPASNGRVQFPITSSANKRLKSSEVKASYTHDGSESRADAFVVEIKDKRGNSASKRIHVIVTAINDAPIAIDDVVTTNEATEVNILVLSNDIDPEGDSLRLASIGQPSNGRTTFGNEGSVNYIPQRGFLGIDRFTYTISDGQRVSLLATVTVTVTKNTPPTAVDDTATVDEDNTIRIPVLDNDSDPEGGVIQLVSVEKPLKGRAIITNDSVSYTPEEHFNGTDRFNYTIKDSNGEQAIANISITVTPVNDSPIALNDRATTNENSTVLISVLSNDTDVEDDTLKITSVTSTVNAVITIDNDNVKYTPNVGFSGTDSFSYTISDGEGGVDTAQVTVIVIANHIPVAEDDAARTNENVSVTVLVLSNDTDPDGDTLTVISTSSPSSGSASINKGQTITYTPNKDFNGTDSFSYSINDGKGGTDTAQVTVVVIANIVNRAPVAENDRASTNEDIPATILVLLNDTDQDGDILTVFSTTSPENGSVSINDGQTVTYTPNKNFNGTDRFSYVVSDGESTSTGLVVVSVIAVNDLPIAIDDKASTNEDVPVTVLVLSNDTDPDGDTLSVVSTTSPTKGSVSVNSGQTVTYTPNKGFNGTDRFSYIVSDGQGGTDTGLVIVSVIAVNDLPIAIDDKVSTNEDVPVTVLVLSNDTDPDGDTLSVVSTTSPLSGSVSINGGKTVTYTPKDNFSGKDRFSYTITDDNGHIATATVDITVIKALIALNPKYKVCRSGMASTSLVSITIPINKFVKRGDGSSIDGLVIETCNTSSNVNILSNVEVQYDKADPADDEQDFVFSCTITDAINNKAVSSEVTIDYSEWLSLSCTTNL